jgi:hypothetical protein
MPILEAARFKAWVSGGSLAGIAGSNPGCMDVCFVSVVYRHTDVSGRK